MSAPTSHQRHLLQAHGDAERRFDVAAGRMDGHEDTITLTTRDGDGVTTLLFRPEGVGPFPAVAIGAEGTGINRFIRWVGASLAERGYVVAIPDFYRGAGPADPESLDDLEGLMKVIDALDFRRAAHDVIDAAEHLRTLAIVDPDRVATWGYCTGGTLALLAAELDPRTAAAVLFYPSQPWFEALDDNHPIHPMDLLWNLRCPTLFLVGDQDVVLTPESLGELRRRLETSGVEHRVEVYEGAGHAFCTEAGGFFHEPSARRGLDDAVAFLDEHLLR